MAPRLVDTVVFVDVDGVLNLGIQQSGKQPVLFSTSNLRFAFANRETNCAAEADVDAMNRLVAVAEAEVGDSDEGTFAQFACNKTHLSPMLVQRLSAIIQKAGANSSIVLASNWRKPANADRVRALESQFRQSLGRPFKFDATTKMCEERTAADRLRCIGQYLAGLCKDRSPDSRPLRALVVDDLFVTPLDGSWTCDGAEMLRASDVESYLCRCAPEAEVAAKFVHTFRSWDTEEGLDLKVGCGITMGHLRQAQEFLDAESVQSSDGRRGQCKRGQGRDQVGAASAAINKVNRVSTASGEMSDNVNDNVATDTVATHSASNDNEVRVCASSSESGEDGQPPAKRGRCGGA